MRFLMALMAALASTLGVSFAQGQPPISNPTGVVPSVSFNDISPILDEVGIPYAVREISGQKIMSLEVNGIRVQFRRRACMSETKCAGLWMFAYINDSTSQRALQEFNQSSKPARALAINDLVVLDRYLIADYGITRGSFLVNLNVFAQMVGQWSTFSKENGPVQVSFEPLMQTRPLAESGYDHGEKEMLMTLSQNPQMINITPSANTPTGQR